MNIDTLVKSFYSDKDETESLINEVMKFLVTESPGDRFSVHIPLPKLTPSEAWGDPNSIARQEVDRVFSAIRRRGSIKERIEHVNSFLDPKQALKKAPGGKVNTLISMMQVIESLQATLNDFNESSAGFVFEGFMAALTQGRQEAGRVGGTLPIEDFITSDGRNVSLKLLSPKTGIHGSFTNLVDYLFIRGGSGVDSIDYLVAYKDKEGENVSRLGVWDFEINRDNIIDMFLQTGKNNVALLGKMANPLKKHIDNWQDSPEWRSQMAQILEQTPGYTWKRGMFNKNLDAFGEFDALEPQEDPNAGVSVTSNFDNMAARGARVKTFQAAKVAGFEHSRENGPDFESWWARIPFEQKKKIGLASSSAKEKTRIKKDKEIGAQIKEKYFNDGVKEAEATISESVMKKVNRSYFGSFHEREKRLMLEENLLIESGKGSESGSQWSLSGNNITDLTSLLNTKYYGEINLSSQNIETVAKIYIKKLGEDMMSLLRTTKEFAENIGLYFTSEDRQEGFRASRDAQSQGVNIINTLQQQEKETENNT